MIKIIVDSIETIILYNILALMDVLLIYTMYPSLNEETPTCIIMGNIIKQTF